MEFKYADKKIVHIGFTNGKEAKCIYFFYHIYVYKSMMGKMRFYTFKYEKVKFDFLFFA